MSNVCKKCGQTKPTDAMYVRNGAVLGTCKDCYTAAVRAGRAAKGGGSVTTKPKATPRAEVSAPASPALTIEPGHGLTAIIHDGYLQMQQSDDEGTDTLMLSRTEARRLFEEFEEWANAS